MIVVFHELFFDYFAGPLERTGILGAYSDYSTVGLGLGVKLNCMTIIEISFGHGEEFVVL